VRLFVSISISREHKGIPETIPVVVFIVEEIWIDRPGKDVPLKLWLRWVNEGVDAYRKSPAGKVRKADIQGHRLGQPSAPV
jgi:hypothetical protein